MRRLERRILISIAATVLLAAIGAAAGYFAGRELSLRLAEDRLQQYAFFLLERARTGASEARSVLAELNTSVYPECSDAELDSMRRILFQSRYLKEAGRIQNDSIACSAVMGRLDQPIKLGKPDYIQRDGTYLYKTLPPPKADPTTQIGLRSGNVYVVYSGSVREFLDRPPMQYILSEYDTSSHHESRLIGKQFPAKGAAFDKDGEARIAGSLFVTRCSPVSLDCVTTYLSYADALRANQAQFDLYIVAGGLTGALIGIFGCIAFSRNRSLERRLRRAIRRDKLQVVYQPIVELAGGRIACAEAQVRWDGRDGHMVGAEIIAQIAEENGYINEITRLTLRHALRDFAPTLRDRPGFRISINVAAADLGNAGFPAMLNEALRQAQVQPRSVAIEITERSTANHDAAIRTVHLLRKQGHPVHIDDFGTGYSSLSYLHELAVDAIKIDRSFIRAIGTEAVTVNILPQILAMAQSLNLQVIAAGIETEEQVRYFARAAPKTLGQGWFFGHPLTAAEFQQALAKSSSTLPKNSEAAQGAA
jgi:sensor c-di-GMP phosphodiesterase-like protein